MLSHLREYHRPKDWKSAHELLDRADGSVKPLFLSTHPLPIDQWPAEAIVDLGQLGLDTITDAGGSITLGSLASLQSIIDSPQLSTRFDGIISQCTRNSGVASTRNYANLGGVLTDLSGPNDILLALLGVDAEVLLHRADNQTDTVPISSFIKREGKVDLGEIISGVQISVGIKGTLTLERLSRTPRDVAIVAVVTRLDIANRVINSARIAVSGASAYPARIQPVEQLLEGCSLTPQLVDMAARAGEAWAEPIGDFRGGSEYRRSMVGVLIRRAIRSAWQKATQPSAALNK